MGGCRIRSEPTPFVPPSFMIGSIILWSGTIASIPSNWQLCDGTNGTPDLTIRFVLGIANEGQRGVIGGSINHDHTFSGDGHQHGISVAAPQVIGTTSPAYKAQTTTGSASGTTDNSDGRPPYYRLAYIMRLS